MLPFFSLPGLQTRTCLGALAGGGDGAFELGRRQPPGIRLCRIDVDRYQLGRRPSGRGRDAGLWRDAGRDIRDVILSRALLAARQVTQRFVEERHIGRVERKIVAAIVEVRRQDEHVTFP